jgi:succinate dehydrogenase/fumarate reductase flavoprotein subunit
VTQGHSDLEVDVAVLGSGGAGLTAAILAHDNGANVAIIERSPFVGGTTAVSGGGVWIALNHHMSELGIEDSREDALAYCQRLAAGRAPNDLIETFIDTGHEMARYLEEHTPVEFTACAMPDYRSEEVGARHGGRTLQPEFYAKTDLREWGEKLRPSPLMFVPMTIEEQMSSMSDPAGAPVATIVDRMKSGMLGSGQALVGRLLRGVLDRGIELHLGTRARQLVREGERVVGVSVERDGGDDLVRARGGVVLACGGFEWNDELRSRFLTGPISHNCTPPYNEGDALTMAVDVGADLGNMSEAWAYPGAMVPGEEHDGHPVSRWIVGERALPHSIVVNRAGRRFVNEGVNYNDMSKALYHFDPQSYEFSNLPCWLIVDRQYREKYPIMTVMPTDPDPDWLTKNESVSGLAETLGVDEDGLQSAITRWNKIVASGKDCDFGRGESAYEHWIGDKKAPQPNLGTVERPPFYALEIGAHSAGTKGGPRTNTRGEVVNVRGKPIAGLYAAGNAMAGISGPGYYGGGGTIGLAMTWGYICGINAAEAAKA